MEMTPQFTEDPSDQGSSEESDGGSTVMEGIPEMHDVDMDAVYVHGM